MSVQNYGLYSHFTLMRRNIFPIQTVLFRKSVYDELGGFDENIETLEDWELWLRYSFHYTFHHMEDTTSVFKIPADQKEYDRRKVFIDKSKEYIVRKYENQKVDFSFQDIYNGSW